MNTGFITCRKRIIFYLILLIISPVAGIGSRELKELPYFITANAGDFFWAVAAYALLGLILCRHRPVVIMLAAFGFSVFVETLQLFQWPFLQALRQHTVGRLLLGTGFLWIDILRYAAGVVFAFLLEWIFTAYMIPEKSGIQNGG